MRRLVPVLLVFAIAAAACSGDASTSTSSTPNISATPTVEPSAAPVVDANDFDTVTPIKHVVFLVKENRTFDNLFGAVPGSERRDGRRRTTGRCAPAHAGYDGGCRTTSRTYYAAALAYDNGKMDGFNQATAAGDWAFTQMPGRAAAELLALGSDYVLGDRVLRVGEGPVVPEPLLHDRRAVGRRARQPGRAGLNRSTTRRGGATHRRAGGRGRGHRGRRVKGPTVLRLPDRGRPAVAQRDIPWAYYAAGERRAATSGRRTRRSAHTATIRSNGRSTSARCERVVDDIRANTLAARDVDHAAVRILRAPRVLLLPRRELDHEGDRRDHACPMWKRHRDLPHVGRLGRLLRSRAAAEQSTTWDWGSGCRCS